MPPPPCYLIPRPFVVRSKIHGKVQEYQSKWNDKGIRVSYHHVCWWEYNVSRLHAVEFASATRLVALLAKNDMTLTNILFFSPCPF